MKLKSFTNKDRYGNMTSFEFYEDSNVPMMEGIPDHPGNPKGTDTVPAWLTPGEFVMNAEATRMFEPQIEQMNNVGRAVQAKQGGTIPEYSAHGGPVYMNQGGSWLDSLLGLFADKALPEMPDATQGAIPPSNTSRDERVAALIEAEKPDGPTRPDPNIANQVYMDFLKDKEGFRNEAYLDSAGVPTIGYGFTEGVKMANTISEEEANKRLLREMAKTDQDYNNLVSADLNPHQQAAVKSLLYNIGGPQFEVSKARAALNAGDFETFKKEAAEFRMADGNVIPGLENRRRDEMDLFFRPYETSKDDGAIAPKKIGTLLENDVYEDDMGVFVNTPEGRVDLNNDQIQAMTRDKPPVEAQKAQVPPMDGVPPIDFSQYSDGPFGPRVPDAIGPRSEDQQIRDEVLLEGTTETARANQPMPVDPGLLAAVKAQKPDPKAEVLGMEDEYDTPPHMQTPKMYGKRDYGADIIYDGGDTDDAGNDHWC